VLKVALAWFENSEEVITREGNKPSIKPDLLRLLMSVASDNFLGMENLQGFEGLSALEESAVRLHEIYKSLMTGGFTEDEALTLIAKMTKPNSE
jgi:hypothetical protein